MAVSGDWLTPRLHGTSWFEKPVLYYWLAAFAYKVLGVSELSARLPSAVAGLFGILAVFSIGRHWIGCRGGIAASLILCASPMYFSLARAASTDMLLTSALALSFTGLYFGYFGTLGRKGTERGNSRGWLLGFYGFLGLAVLAKGPVALALVGSSLALFSAVVAKGTLIRMLVRPDAMLLGLVVALPWYVLCYLANGWIFVDQFLLSHNLARFTSDRFQHSQPFWFYGLVVFAGFFPWIFQVVPPVWHWVRRGFQKKEKRSKERIPTSTLAGNGGNSLPSVSKGDKGPQSLTAFANSGDLMTPTLAMSGKQLFAEESFLWTWVIVPFVFFSLSRSKLPAYILPVFPPLALLAAREWERIWDSQLNTSQPSWLQSSILWQAVSVLVLGVAIPFGVEALDLNLNAFVRPLTILVCATGICAILFVRSSRTGPLFCVYLAGAAMMTLLITEGIIPRLNPLESCRDLAAAVRQQGFNGEPVFVYRLSRRVEYGLGFYLDAPTKLIYSEGDVDYPLQGKLFLITEPTVNAESVLFRARVESEAEFLGQKIVRMSVKNGDNTAIRASTGPDR
jgi:4-amino-4-deoxy-L-arabinose transferase-like glycosyltransferase